MRQGQGQRQESMKERDQKKTRKGGSHREETLSKREGERERGS